jgi:hypothetical protein
MKSIAMNSPEKIFEKENGLKRLEGFQMLERLLLDTGLYDAKLLMRGSRRSLDHGLSTRA